MKLFTATSIGAIAGGVIGFLAPGALYQFLRATDPGFDRPGDSAGTLFALAMPFTAIAGLALGAFLAAGFSTERRLFKELSIGATLGGVVGVAAPIIFYKYLHSMETVIFTIPAGMGFGALIAAAFGRGLRG
jgi:hypothetical protein